MSGFSVRDMAKIALMGALMCVLGPLSLSFGPIPFSLMPLMVCISVCVLGTKNGTSAVVLYLIMGTVGLPVFGGYSGGLGVVMGPTGGYLIGFIFLAAIGGMIGNLNPSNEYFRLVGLTLGLAVLYLFGTLWFCHLTKWSFGRALGVCVYPFVVFDMIKIVLAVLLGHVVRKRVPSLQVQR